MKKIINNKKYDTKTAKCVAEWSNNLPCNDFRYQAEDLHQKNNGEYFLWVEGGPLSDYTCSYGNAVCGDRDIIPLTPTEAKEWVMKRCNDEYEDIFGEVEE